VLPAHETRPGVSEVDAVLWHGRAATTEDNDGLLSVSEEAWPAYVAAIDSRLGPPDLSTTWAADDFPESPRWLPRELRMEERKPYRLAVWGPARPDGPTTEMWINLAHGTATRRFTGGAYLRLALRSPALIAVPPL
jgi:hypothetical protein